MKETDALDEYILQHIDEETDYLKALYRLTPKSGNFLWHLLLSFQIPSC